MSFQNCTAVSPACPVDATTYGYVPDLGANVTLLVVFAVCAVLQVVFGVLSRSWSFMVGLGVGCVLEFVGYIGRVQMHQNAWSSSGFRQQIVCLILAPSFVAAGIYLSLKHIILYLGPEASRLKPQYYTWIFIGCDAISILIQAAGGGVAGAAGAENQNLLNVGNNMMIAGIAFQVATMSVCGVLAVDFVVRYRHHTKGKSSASSTQSLEKSSPVSTTRFRLFCIAEVFAYIVVLIRCIYRLPEMAGGWGNPLMRNETEFLILDGMMVALAAVVFTIFHPGYWFPPMTGRRHTTKEADCHEMLSS